MKSPSAAPRSTTLVSPVTMGTSASRAVAAMLAQTARSSSSAKPSSMTKAAASASGRAAAVARSLTVPATERRPMSPPGKRSGCTTWLSVVNAMRPDGASAAASSRRSRTGLAKAAHEHVLDEVAVELAAAAVTEEHAAAADARRGSTALPPLRAVSHRCPGSGSAPRRRPRCETMQAPTGSSGVQRRAEQRAVGRVGDAAQHLAAAAAGRFERRLRDRPGSARAASTARELGSQIASPEPGMTPRPRQSASLGSKTCSMQPLRDEVALGPHGARVLDLDGRLALAHEHAAAPRGCRAARSRPPRRRRRTRVPGTRSRRCR